MTNKRFAKIAAGAIGAVAALSFAGTAGAQTAAELQAQIQALMAKLNAMQGTASVTFTTDLTVGSSGAQVVALQSFLESKGYLVMPAGVAKGYFGGLTRAAVARFQAANGITPAAGYFGPKTRAVVNGMGTVVVPGGTTGSGTVGGGSTTGGVITTPGVEGTLTATLNASPASGQTVREGDSKVAVLGIELEARTSDVRIERIKLDLDQASGGTNDADFYRDIAQRVYIMSGSTVLASADLNSDTVIKDGDDYFVTITGLNYVVPKNTERVLTVAIDARSSFDSEFEGDTWTVTVPVNGIRGVDGASIDLYAPSTAFSRTFTSQADAAEDASLVVSTNASTPADQELVCSSGTDEDECDALEILRANFKAEDDAITITDLVVDINMTGADTATATTAYLYDGNTLVGSESIDGLVGTNSVTFDDIDFVVPKDTTKTLTLKIDVENATFAANIFTADIDANDVTAENTDGDSVTATGSATGESTTVRKAGLEVTLLSKSISKTEGQFSGATSSLKADFKVRLTARGGNVEFGDTASTTYPLADNDGSLTAGISFQPYVGGTETNPVVASSTSMVIGSGVSAAGGANSWVLPEGNSVEVDLSYVMFGKTSAGADVTAGAYAVALERLNWLTLEGGRQTTTFMDGNAAWRTGTVVLP